MGSAIINKFNFYIALPVAFFVVSAAVPEAKANIECPDSLDVKDSICDAKYSSPEQQSQKMQCKQKCQKAKQACQKAKSTCDGAKGKEAKDIADGQNAASDAGSSSNGNQGANNGAGGTQGPNASNMCSGQQANQNRAADGAPVPPAMQQCATAARQCEDPSGPEAAGKASENATQNAAQNAQRLADAGKMGQKCQESKNNEDKMPQISPPQIPPKEKDDPLSQQPTEVASEPSATAPAEDKPKIDGMNFGETAKVAKVDMDTSPKPDSAISGSSGSGATYGAGASGPSDLSAHDKSGSPNGGGAAMPIMSGGSFGSQSASGGNLAPSAKDGIAPSEIKPEKAGEVAAAGGGKSVLGLKASSDDEISLPTVGIPSKVPVGASHDASAARGPAGTGKGALAATGDGATLFMMVRSRYRNLRELGSI